MGRKSGTPLFRNNGGATRGDRIQRVERINENETSYLNRLFLVSRSEDNQSQGAFNNTIDVKVAKQGKITRTQVERGVV